MSVKNLGLSFLIAMQVACSGPTSTSNTTTSELAESLQLEENKAVNFRHYLGREYLNEHNMLAELLSDVNMKREFNTFKQEKGMNDSTYFEQPEMSDEEFQFNVLFELFLANGLYMLHYSDKYTIVAVEKKGKDGVIYYQSTQYLETEGLGGTLNRDKIFISSRENTNKLLSHTIIFPPLKMTPEELEQVWIDNENEHATIYNDIEKHLPKRIQEEATVTYHFTNKEKVSLTWMQSLEVAAECKNFAKHPKTVILRFASIILDEANTIISDGSKLQPIKFNYLGIHESLNSFFKEGSGKDLHEWALYFVDRHRKGLPLEEQIPLLEKQLLSNQAFLNDISTRYLKRYNDIRNRTYSEFPNLKKKYKLD